jgi:hypothetical protein
MKLFGWFRRKKKLPSLEVAIATLQFQAGIGIDEDSFQGIERKYVSSINQIIYFTKASIIIHWLRILEHKLSDPARAVAILEGFERSLFPDGPSKEALEMITYIDSLIKQTTESQKIAGDKSASETEFVAGVRSWWEGWLEPLTDDKEVIQRVGWRCGLQLFNYLHGETTELGKLVSAVVFG